MKVNLGIGKLIYDEVKKISNFFMFSEIISISVVLVQYPIRG